MILQRIQMLNPFKKSVLITHCPELPEFPLYQVENTGKCPCKERINQFIIGLLIKSARVIFPF